MHVLQVQRYVKQNLLLQLKVSELLTIFVAAITGTICQRSTAIWRKSIRTTAWLKNCTIATVPIPLWRCGPTRAMASSFMRFLDHTQRRTTVGRTPLDEWSARRRNLYLTTHNTHNRQTSMPRGGIRTHDLSRRAAADLRLRPRGHWGRQLQQIAGGFYSFDQSHSLLQMLIATLSSEVICQRRI